MFLDIVIALTGLLLLFGGGEALVRGASSLSLRLGVSPLVVGLTVVAFGTSAPELVVSLRAALAGSGDIAVGNVVGSNIANVALILGIAALVRPPRVAARIVRRDAPVMIVAAIVLVAVLTDGVISRPEGLLLFAGLVVYVVFNVRGARRESAAVQREFADGGPEQLRSSGPALLLVAVGLPALAVGGHLLVAAAVRLAAALGVGEAVIGLTVVAVGTSLPELATSLVAAARSQGDIAVGNVIGSNIFNVLGILGASALLRPLATSGIGTADLGMLLVTALAALAMLYTRLEVERIEGGVLLAVYAAYAGWLFLG